MKRSARAPEAGRGDRAPGVGGASKTRAGGARRRRGPARARVRGLGAGHWPEQAGMGAGVGRVFTGGCLGERGPTRSEVTLNKLCEPSLRRTRENSASHPSAEPAKAGLAHLPKGGAAGAAAGLVELNVRRRRPLPMRWPGWLGRAPLPPGWSMAAMTGGGGRSSPPNPTTAGPLLNASKAPVWSMAAMTASSAGRSLIIGYDREVRGLWPSLV